MLVVQAAVLAAVLEEDQSNETALSEIFYGPGFVDLDVLHSPMYSIFVILDLMYCARQLSLSASPLHLSDNDCTL